MKKILLLLPLVALVSFSLTENQNAYGYIIGIQHDKTCQALIAAGDTWTCPTFEQIDELFPKMELKAEYQNLINNQEDEINQIKNNNKIEKLASDCIRFNYCNHFVPGSFYYQSPSDFLSRSMDTITITTNMKIKNPIHLKYSDITQITTDNKRQINFELNQLYVTPNCKDAIFNPGSDWRYELGHLIYYMSENCSDPRVLTHFFDMNYTVETDITEYSPLDSPNYLIEKELQKDILRCKEKC